MSHAGHHHGNPETRLWQDGDGHHIDLRGLSPPEPMVEILRLLESGAVVSLTAHFDRDPIFLYPELDERGWSYETMPSCGGDACEHERVGLLGLQRVHREALSLADKSLPSVGSVTAKAVSVVISGTPRSALAR